MDRRTQWRQDIMLKDAEDKLAGLKLSDQAPL